MAVRRGDPCTIGDCAKPVVGRGWCSMHYGRWRTYGDPLHETRRYVAQSETCAVESCERPTHGLGLCKMHYRRAHRHGETTNPEQRRFWAQVDRGGDNDCWEWTGYRQANGYGVRGNAAGQSRLVHRIAYEWLIGAIPPGLVLDHVCHTRAQNCRDNEQCPHRRCVNPAHLEPVTRRENIARGNGGDSWGYIPEKIIAKPQAQKPTSCTEPNCDGAVYKRTICRKHYRRWLRDPSVERPSQRTPEQRFWAKVEKTSTCWLWTAAVNPGTGYGQFAPRHGVQTGAHRFAYEVTNGPVPDGYDVHHTCMTRRCVNPEHLQAVTRSDNLRMRANRR